MLETAQGASYLVLDAMADVRRLERAGFLLYSSEIVCGRCSGASELAFVNVSWARERLRVYSA